MACEPSHNGHRPRSKGETPPNCGDLLAPQVDRETEVQPYARYGAIPFEAVRRGLLRMISGGELKLWTAIGVHQQFNRAANPNVAVLAEQIGLSQRQVQRLTKNLLDKGLIKVEEHPGRGNKNTFRLVEKPDIQDVTLSRSEKVTKSATSRGEKVTSGATNGDTQHVTLGAGAPIKSEKKMRNGRRSGKPAAGAAAAATSSTQQEEQIQTPEQRSKFQMLRAAKVGNPARKEFVENGNLSSEAVSEEIRTWRQRGLPPEKLVLMLRDRAEQEETNAEQRRQNDERKKAVAAFEQKVRDLHGDRAADVLRALQIHFNLNTPKEASAEQMVETHALRMPVDPQVVNAIRQQHPNLWLPAFGSAEDQEVERRRAREKAAEVHAQIEERRRKKDEEKQVKTAAETKIEQDNNAWFDALSDEQIEGYVEVLCRQIPFLSHQLREAAEFNLRSLYVNQRLCSHFGPYSGNAKAPRKEAV